MIFYVKMEIRSHFLYSVGIDRNTKFFSSAFFIYFKKIDSVEIKVILQDLNQKVKHSYRKACEN